MYKTYILHGNIALRNKRKKKNDEAAIYVIEEEFIVVEPIHYHLPI